MKKLYVLLIACLGFSYSLVAQEKSAAIIENIRSLYNLGRMDSIPKILLTNDDNFDFIKGDIPDVSKDDTPEAFKFLALSYIFLDEGEKADKAMLRLLKEDNLFKTNETDPAELHNLLNTYRTWPIFRFGIFYGVNASFTDVRALNGTQDFGAADERGEYSTNVGVVNAGLVLEKDFLKNLVTLQTDFYYGTLKTKYNQETGVYQGTNEPTAKISRIDEIESQSFFGMNIIGQVHPFYKGYVNKTVKPYAFIGGTINVLQKATVNSTATQFDGTNGVKPSIDDELLVKSEENNQINVRSKFNYYVLAGIGSKFQFGKFNAFANVRYNYNLNEMTEKIQNEGLLYKANNQIKIHYVQISLGIMFDIFAPKKLTN